MILSENLQSELTHNAQMISMTTSSKGTVASSNYKNNEGESLQSKKNLMAEELSLQQKETSLNNENINNEASKETSTADKDSNGDSSKNQPSNLNKETSKDPNAEKKRQDVITKVVTANGPTVHNALKRSPELLALINLQTQRQGECPMTGPLPGMGCAVDGISGGPACQCSWIHSCEVSDERGILKLVNRNLTIGVCVENWRAQFVYGPFIIMMVLLGVGIVHYFYSRFKIFEGQQHMQSKYLDFWQNTITSSYSLAPQEPESDSVDIVDFSKYDDQVSQNSQGLITFHEREENKYATRL